MIGTKKEWNFGKICSCFTNNESLFYHNNLFLGIFQIFFSNAWNMQSHTSMFPSLFWITFVSTLVIPRSSFHIIDFNQSSGSIKSHFTMKSTHQMNFMSDQCNSTMKSGRWNPGQNFPSTQNMIEFINSINQHSLVI